MALDGETHPQVTPAREDEGPSGALATSPEKTCASTLTAADIAARFNELGESRGPDAALSYLYNLSCEKGYVHAEETARNESWTAETTWGELEITVNLSKPEKDPREIARLAEAEDAAKADAGAGACQLCFADGAESASRRGTRPDGLPAGPNLCIQVAPLDGADRPLWGLQYSPYAYFDEHCIAVSPVHEPMHIDGETLRRLVRFADLYPSYIVGSNADLPVVGGSILAHDHFQAGRHVFPIERASVEQETVLAAWPSVECAVVRWPMTTIRLASQDGEALVGAASHVLETWRAYADPEVGVLSETDGVPHNTITPVVRKSIFREPHGAYQAARYTMYLILRCNVASTVHPLGVFHPHEHLHHIKRENIGLIEAMGLAILPGRLERELASVEEKVLGNLGDAATMRAALLADETTAKHAEWALEIAKRRTDLCRASVRDVLREEVGAAFAEVLECAGVFKHDADGRQALARFLATL